MTHYTSQRAAVGGRHPAMHPQRRGGVAVVHRKAADLFVDRPGGPLVDDPSDCQPRLLLKLPHSDQRVRAEDAGVDLRGIGDQSEAQEEQLMVKEADVVSLGAVRKVAALEFHDCSSIGDLLVVSRWTHFVW